MFVLFVVLELRLRWEGCMEGGSAATRLLVGGCASCNKGREESSGAAIVYLSPSAIPVLSEPCLCTPPRMTAPLALSGCPSRRLRRPRPRVLFPLSLLVLISVGASAIRLRRTTW
ncbi:unnamed protein product [Phaeothamnion confervicola]